MTEINDVTVALVGNVNPEVYWSTENEYMDAYVRAGVKVCGFQEGEESALRLLLVWIRSDDPPSLVHWTRTKALADKWGDGGQWELIAACRRAEVPLIGVHLDRWWGLKSPDRESQLFTDPYFKGVDIMFTADGGHQQQWKHAGINHRWLLPAISERWLGVGEPNPNYECDVVFVGGWDNYGHKAWKHRGELINFLSRTYGDRFLALPRRGAPRIVGRELNDVYASAKVVVGDSALIPLPDGSPMNFYCSDRVPETVARGGYLLHPAVEGINAGPGDAFWRSEAPLCDHWEMGDWHELRARIDTELREGTYGAVDQRQWRVDQMAASETYTHRVGTIVEHLTKEGVL